MCVVYGGGVVVVVGSCCFGLLLVALCLLSCWFGFRNQIQNAKKENKCKSKEISS